MPTARLIRILARLAVDGGTEGAPRLCTVCAEVTDVDGAGIMLLAGDRPQGSVCTSDDVSTQIEELQYTLGEGPCIDAHRQHVPVIEPDLADPVTTRWTAFSPAALAAGARAVFGSRSPSALHVGAMNLYRNRPGTLSDGAACRRPRDGGCRRRAILTMQSTAAPGTIGAELEGARQLPLRRPPGIGDGGRPVGCPRRRGAGALRAHAFVVGRSVTDVARDVVDVVSA